MFCLSLDPQNCLGLPAAWYLHARGDCPQLESEGKLRVLEAHRPWIGACVSFALTASLISLLGYCSILQESKLVFLGPLSIYGKKAAKVTGQVFYPRPSQSVIAFFRQEIYLP